MSVYYADDQVTLYHGDCLEIDAWLKADVLVTDPPYGIDWKQGDYDGTSRRSDDRTHTGIANDSTCSVRAAVLSKWGMDRPAVVFGSFRAPPPVGVVQTLVWRKPADAGVVGSTTGYRTDVEPVFLIGPHTRRTASRSAVLESRSNKNSYIRVGNTVGSIHPHAKPPAILEQLVEWTNGTIADPFAGSGSTLIAARNLGRKAIGVEVEERYCEIIARRLNQMALNFEESAVSGTCVAGGERTEHVGL